MKKHFLLFVVLLCMPFAYAADINLNGVAYRIDTLNQFVAGPGCEYWATRMTRVSDGNGRLDAYFLRVDMNNPYIRMQAVMGQDKLIGTERPSAMITRKSTPTSVYVGGTNGTFYVTEGDIGCPKAPAIIDREFLYLGGSGRGVGAVDVNGFGVFGTVKCWKFSGKLNLPDTTIAIKNINYATRGENQLIVYNSYLASTRTDNTGTEVIVKLKEGESWKTTGNVKLVVVDVLKDQGNTSIAKGQYVLSGHGTKATELNKLQIGDEVSIDFTFKVNDVARDLQHCIGADWYSQIITDGEVVQEGFWDELHPRTGYGADKAGNVLLLCVVDGRGNSVGCTTQVLGEIMKHNGAWNAVNFDGGGSSCMAINGFGQMNDPADASGERAVGDGFFAVADVPTDDHTIATIRPYEYKYTLPYFGMYAPKFYGYNQYGVMIDTDVQGVVLSCDAALGEIQEDGSFLASGTQDGTLQATLGNITTTIDIFVNRNAQIAFRLDSVLIDNRSAYEIEVVSQVNGNEVTLPAHVLEWEVEDESICNVNAKGELLGLKNGRTSVVGTMGDFSDTLQINVEIPPTSEYLWENFVVNDSWTVSATSGFNPTFPAPTSSVLPVVLDFTYKVGRKPFILLEKEVPLYGLPDSVRIHLNTDAVIESIALALRANNQTSSQFATHTFKSVPTNVDTTFTIAVSDLFDVSDRAIYPIWMKSLRFNIATTTTAGAHKIALRGIGLYYEGVDVTYLDQTAMPTWVVYPNPVEDGMLQVCNLTAASNLLLCDIQGRELLRQNINTEQVQINIQAYPAGQYLLTINNQTVKIIKK